MKISFNNIKLKKLPEIFKGNGNYAGISLNEEASSVCTDSRECSAGSIFAAIKGEVTDGHLYISKAVSLGAVAVICEYIPENAPSHCLYILCENTEKALMEGARTIRKNYPSLSSVAVTGSVGKTTAKEAIFAALSACTETYKIDGNFNSTIGMPMALMAMPGNTETAVFEMGMSGLGEIHEMSTTLMPDVAVITNVGHSHLEYLKTRENILKAKLEVTDGLKDNGTLVVNGDDTMLRTVDFSRFSFKTVRCSMIDSEADYFAENVNFGDGEMLFDVKTQNGIVKNVRIPGTGYHLVLSSLFAVACADALGFDSKVAAKGLAEFKNAAMRQNVVNVGKITVIEDCYNAAPESMRSAIDTLKKLNRSGKRTFALLGEMRELGKDSARLHFELGKFVAEKGIDSVIGFGNLGSEIVNGAIDGGMNRSETYLYTNTDDCERVAKLLFELMEEGDTLLVKASRSLRAERIIESLKVLYGE